MPKIENNISAVSHRLEQAARDAGRNPDEILLLAVSKTRSAEDIRCAIDAGMSNFGENYVQEALEKIALLTEELGREKLHWHFIGPLQSNKSRVVAENFNWVHSVDRLKIAQRLSDQRPAELGPLNICLQVNIDDEASKSGFSPDQVLSAALEIIKLPHLRLRGLMAIPQAQPTVEKQKIAFNALYQLRDQINRSLDNSEKLDTLSMGMSNDLEAAISQGSTMVRVGTDIFGKRDPKKSLKESNRND
jgi:pyridoxal phosphate enzyme (YggS family)|tara:strand:- start:3912 stop:4652 length:741 start_codon:yes stop_codon:yes gene_type:complete